jgi:hypothetical protein
VNLLRNGCCGLRHRWQHLWLSMNWAFLVTCHLGHVVIYTYLFTHLWWKLLFKLADILIEIPAGAGLFWPSALHTSLLIGFLLPFASSFPWQHWNWCGAFQQCGKICLKMSGLFCINFAFSHDCWGHCNMVWCGAC